MTDDDATSGTSDKPVRVVLVNEDEIIIVGLRGMLARHSDRVNVVGGAIATENVLAKSLELEADVVLLETALHHPRGLELAAELVAGEETVKTHLRSIYRKLGVNDRAHAIATVLRQGIFT